MAVRYWVGGDGNWSDARYHWSDTSGGTPNASFLPTAADDVVFDANSNTGTSAFTVFVDGTTTAPSLCQDFSTSSLDGAMTLLMGSTSRLFCYGSLTFPATNFSCTGVSGSVISFRATTTGKTITTNGVVLNSVITEFNGAGGGWTLGSALTQSASSIFMVIGTLTTNNFNVSIGSFFAEQNDVTSTLSLGSSTLTLSNNWTVTGSGFSIVSGTSTIVCSAAAATFTGGGLTYNNVTFSGGAGTKTINGANTFNGQFLVSNAASTGLTFGANQTFTGGALIQATTTTFAGGFSYSGTVEFASAAHGTKTFSPSSIFQNLTITCPAVDGITSVSLNGSATVTGTLTTSNGGSTARRVRFISGLDGAQRTFTVGTNSLINTDFQSIAAAGTASWTFGLGYGDLGNNSGITFNNSTLYWIGGTGNWSSTTNWSTSSGGSAANAVPCAQNSVIFDANSNVGTGAFTVTGNAAMFCNDFSTGGAGGALDGAMTLTMGATAVLNCYGSMTLPATNFSVSGTSGAILNFLSNTTGKTITTNGVSLGNVAIFCNSPNGEWTLGSAFTTAVQFTVLQGSFLTGNFNLTAASIISSVTNIRSITLGSSTLTLSGNAPVTFTTSTNLTFNAGTSTITCSAASPTFAGGGLTFNNVTFSSTAIGTVTITGANTFNNLTFTARAAAGIGFAVFDANVTNTINGTLTLGSGTTGVARLNVRSSFAASPATLSVATLAAITDIDFRDITAAGASSPWSGTRIGDCRGNTNITFTAARTVYWNSAASANWNGAVWSTTSGNTGGTTTAFPLAQDTIIIDNAGLTTGNTITLNASYNIPTLDFSNRSNAATFATGATSTNFFGDYILSSAITVSGTGALAFARHNGTATITSAGVTFTQPVTLNAFNGTLRINGNLTLGSTLTFTISTGTLDLTNGGAGNFTLSTGLFSSNNSNARAITFGTGNITLTGNNAAIWACGTLTNFTISGTPTVNSTYSGSTGTRTFNHGATGGGSETNAISLNVSAGTDTVAIGGASVLRNLNFTGFSGSLTGTSRVIYGNLIFSSGMSFNAGGVTTLAASSGTQQLTTNGQTLEFLITKDGAGTLQLQDNLTLGSTRTFTLLAGTLDLTKGGTANLTLSTGIFGSTGTNARVITFGTGNITLTGNNAFILNVNATNLSYTGTPTINSPYSGAVGIRSFTYSSGAIETNALNINITAGTDTVTFPLVCKNADFTGFSGSLSGTTRVVYGNLIISNNMVCAPTAFTTTFAATSGTQQITTAGKTLDFPLTFNGIGSTFAFQDALTQGLGRAFTVINGTIQFIANTVNTVGAFATSGTNIKYLISSVLGIQATISQAIGEVIVEYLSIRDSNATGGATFNARSMTNIDANNNTGWYFGGAPVFPTDDTHDGFTPEEIRRAKEISRKIRQKELALLRAQKAAKEARKETISNLVDPKPIAKPKKNKLQSIQEVKADIPSADTQELERSIAYLESQREKLFQVVNLRRQRNAILARLEAERLAELDDEQAILLLL